MDCPNCHTWNPDDKTVCWRCQTVLPKPVEKKPKRSPGMFMGLPTWTWLLLAGMIIFWFVTSILPSIIGR